MTDVPNFVAVSYVPAESAEDDPGLLDRVEKYLWKKVLREGRAWAAGHSADLLIGNRKASQSPYNNMICVKAFVGGVDGVGIVGGSTFTVVPWREAGDVDWTPRDRLMALYNDPEIRKFISVIEAVDHVAKLKQTRTT